MQDILSMLNSLRRPRLLIRAARFGTRDYRRERHLQRILGYGGLPRPATALMRLIELERELEDSRQADDGRYSLSRHLDVLIAMMGEAELLRQTRADEAGKADKLADGTPAANAGLRALRPKAAVQVT